MSRDGGIVYPLSWALGTALGFPGQCRTRLYPPSRNSHVYSTPTSITRIPLRWLPPEFEWEVGSRREFLPDLEVRFPSSHGLESVPGHQR